MLNLYNRTVRGKIQKDLFQGKVILLYGARQVGKTTLVKELIKDIEDSVYIDCEIIGNRQAIETDNIENLRMFLGDKRLVVLDEAQKVKDIGVKLKIIHDHFPEIQIIATGSSSFDLSNRVNEPLTGRAFEYKLYPMSLDEITQKKNIVYKNDKIERVLRFGSYPDIVDRDDELSIRILEQITSNYLYKDILEFENIKKSDQLVNILQHLSFQIGNQVSFSEIGKKIGLNTMTVQKYIDLLEKNFVIFKLKGFSRNLRKEITKSVKIYFWDLGIRNSLIRNFNPLNLRNDVGVLWENFLIAERLKNNSNNQRFVNSYFWRTYDQKEIDYIEEAGGMLQAYEMKWNKGKEKIPQDFLNSYKDSKFTFIDRSNYLKFLDID